MKKIALAAALAAALSISLPACAADAATEVVKTPGAKILSVPVTKIRIDSRTNLIYSQPKGRHAGREGGLRMTLLTPATAGKKPAVVYFPGGGFMQSDYDKYVQMRMALAEAGFVVAAAEYRPLPAEFPALLEDAKAAVRFLRAHANEFGIDKTRIAVLGDSAGGYLAQMAGATNGERKYDKGDFLNESSYVQAVVSFYGISDLRSIGEGHPEAVERNHHSPSVTEAVLVSGFAFGAHGGKTIDEAGKAAIEASPIGHVDGNEPPYLLFHGVEDPLVSPLQSSRMFKALKDKKEDAELRLVKGAKHGDRVWYQPEFRTQVVEWLKSKIGSPDTSREGKTNNL
ncbi:MAG: alpha/beta hydrolase [Sutterellaceae bacterium]|nr:alpha/beta hydrolase [Sutterellaceae bacterium]MDD7441746.1 alpha/beta hydrolase [Sutterellaceae bacterium]MDY2868687.1 alpha/beta hydrolase [Mesosutterella sp.]